MREDVAAKREGNIEATATRKEIAMQNMIAKANAEYNDLIAKNPLMNQPFLDKEGTKRNPNYMSRTEYFRQTMQRPDLVSSSIPTPGQRAPIGSLIKPLG
jgi:hypothetical protein